jgi:hypothetical protein
LLKAFIQILGFHIQNLPQLSFWVETFYGAEGGNGQNLWAIFHCHGAAIYNCVAGHVLQLVPRFAGRALPRYRYR